MFLERARSPVTVFICPFEPLTSAICTSGLEILKKRDFLFNYRVYVDQNLSPCLIKLVFFGLAGNMPLFKLWNGERTIKKACVAASVEAVKVKGE